MTYAHQTVLRHPARFLALVALRADAAHVEEAEWRLAAVAVRFEDGVQARERVVVAYAAYLGEIELAGLGWCDCDGPVGGGLSAWMGRND